MRVSLLHLAICFCLAISIPASGQAPRATAPASPPDPVLRSMTNEIARTRQLTLIAGAPLYYVSYLFAKGDSFLVAASNGALLNRLDGTLRVPTVNVRVGNYDSDHANFVATGIYQGTRYPAERFPLDDNDLAMRRNWWLLTDMAYKSGAQSLNLKRASLQNVQASSNLPDYTRPDQPTVLLLPESTAAFDKSLWEQRVRKLSALFKRQPAILDSQVQFGFSRGTEYFANSEGSIVRRPFGIGFLRIVASTLAADHTTLWDNLEYLALRDQDFPSEQQIQADIERMMDRLVASTAAPMAENYRGPVLFEGQAAAQLVAQLIGRQLWIPRKPVSVPNRPVNWPRPELEGRLGMTVISEKLSVRDDPTLRSFASQPLVGHTEVDLEAVVPQPLTLIRAGKLEALFRTRTPSTEGDISNGRARIPGIFGAHRGAPSNLIIEASESVPEDSLKQQLIAMATRAGKPYGLLVRKLDFPSTGPSATLAKAFSGATGGGKMPVSLPLAIYRVYPDGREELVRGVSFRDLELRALRDLAAAGDRQHIFQYLENGAMFAQMGAGSYVAECSIISPSLLLEEVELEPVNLDLPTQPLVEPPALTGALRATN